MEELQVILDNFWILRDNDKENYYKVRDAQDKLKPFLEEKLGYKLIVNSRLVKLEKVPADAEAWMGIEDFKAPMDYSFLCLLLAFLEEKGPEEQFVLSNVTEYLQAAFPGDEKIDWTLFSHRKSLVRVMQFAAKIGVLKITDGEQERFSQDESVEVLYENTGVSGYFLRNFGREIDLSEPDPYKVLSEERPEHDPSRGNLRRYRVYRKLIISPAVYGEGPDDQDFLYIKNYRNTIKKDIAENLGARLDVHKSSAFLIYDHSNYLRSYFPSNHNISDIILQLSYIIRQKTEKGDVELKSSDIIELSEVEFAGLISECRDKFKNGWYKTYRELSKEKLIEEVTQAMISWKMIERDEAFHSVKIMPLLGKFIGTYPQDFNKGA